MAAFPPSPKRQPTLLDGINQNVGNTWHELLSEVSQKTAAMPEDTNVLMLGDIGAGKRTLLSALRGDVGETQREGHSVLDFSYIDVCGDDEDDILSRIHVWQLSDITQSELLKFSVSEKNLEKTLAIIVLDVKRPWRILPSLLEWLSVLEHHIKTVTPKLSHGKYSEMQKAMETSWKGYKEIVENADKEEESDEEDQKGSITSPSLVGRNSSGAAKMMLGKGSSMALFETPVNRQTRVSSEVDVDASELPLPEGVLTHNLGIPIVVAVCKTDLLNQVAQVNDYKEGHLEFIQQRLRHCCLQYGAGLFHLSSVTKRNVRELHEYVLHHLYSMPYDRPVCTVEQQGLRIPSGWDTISKVKVIFDSNRIAPNGLNTPYEDVIKDPKQRGIGQTSASIVTVQDEQEFLATQRDVQRIGAKDKQGDYSGDPTVRLYVCELYSLILQSHWLRDYILTGGTQRTSSAAATEAEARNALKEMESRRASRGLIADKTSSPATLVSPSSSRAPVTSSPLASASAGGTPSKPSAVQKFFNDLLVKDGPTRKRSDSMDMRKRAEAELAKIKSGSPKK